MEKEDLMIEEFKQAGQEYTFFQDLALKYLKFYAAAIGIVTTTFLGISYHFSNIKITDTDSMGRFLIGPFLAICGWSVVIIGIITAFTLVKCRGKCIDSIKSMMRVRQFFYDKDMTGESKKYSYYANVAPRYYQLRSTTQGILIIIAFINAIAYMALSMGGIEKVFIPNLNFLLGFVLNFLPLFGLVFIQYMVIFKYLIRKDVVRLDLKFKPEQKVKEIKICYNIPRSITNNSFSHIISRILYWLVDLPERENIRFLRRGKTHCHLVTIKNDRISLELIAGYYQLIAQGYDGNNYFYYKPKDLLMLTNIYREYCNDEILELTPGSKKDYDDFKVKEPANRLGELTKKQRIRLYLETKYLTYLTICYLFTLKKDFYSLIIFPTLAIFVIAPKFCIDIWKKSRLPKLIQIYPKIFKCKLRKLIKKS